MSSWLKLVNKTAVVTGAGSGIGAAVARALSEQGSQVVLADVSKDHLHAIEKDCNVVASIECDVSKEDHVKRLFQSVPPEAPSILINCAGITRDGWIGQMDTVDQWQAVLDVNLTGTFLCCREFLNQELPGGGAIVNVSSVVALQGNLGQTNYAASKGGVWSLTKALAKEVAHRNVRVNCVAPGFIETPMVASVPDKVQDAVRQKVALGKFGSADDVANLILFLASCERSGYITGEAMECSGLISL